MVCSLVQFFLLSIIILRFISLLHTAIVIPFYTEYYSIEEIHQILFTHLCCLQFLALKNTAVAVNIMSKSLCGHTFLFFLSKYQEQNGFSSVLQPKNSLKGVRWSNLRACLICFPSPDITHFSCLMSSVLKTAYIDS